MTHLRFDLTIAEYEALTPEQKREWNEWIMEMWSSDIERPTNGVERYDDWSRR